MSSPVEERPEVTLKLLVEGLIPNREDYITDQFLEAVGENTERVFNMGLLKIDLFIETEEDELGRDALTVASPLRLRVSVSRRDPRRGEPAFTVHHESVPKEN